jgi:hypothetical protein
MIATGPLNWAKKTIRRRDSSFGTPYTAPNLAGFCSTYRAERVSSGHPNNSTSRKDISAWFLFRRSAHECWRAWRQVQILSI